MREGDDLLHGAPGAFPLQPVVCLSCYGGGNIVDAAHGGDNPYLVAHAHLAVGTVEAHEGHVAGFLPGGFRLRNHRLIGILQQIPQSSPYIVGVNPRACLYRLFCVADAVAVFDDLSSLGDIADRHLMTCGNLLKSRYLFLTALDPDAYGLPCGNSLQSHHHIVVVVYFYEILHNAALMPFALISSR